MSQRIIGSLARIADFGDQPYDVAVKPKSEWATGDYVEAEVTGEPSPLYRIEDTAGEMIPVAAGDRVVGALGEREATLEGVGSWRAVEDDGRIHCLTNAGLLGRFTSISSFLDRPVSLDYIGHLERDGRKLKMRDFALGGEFPAFAVPTILLVGTSMSAGKTSTGRLVVKTLSDAGFDVIGAKLTGAGRYRDVLSFREAGAREIYDFVDVGLPSTVVPESDFREAVRPLLGMIGQRKPDFLVAEAGASPLEPYNGSAAIDELGNSLVCTILCASDPYAVLGVERAFNFQPDIVSGPATTTSAARELVRKLTGVPAYNILDPASLPGFRQELANRLGIELPGG